ncbi:carboxymuconolactone decarboxylase family protein [Nocardioides carbamazepini]|uniref:carboxymuconolactone decarboxylase family protein n=1 Tax=Nocardioides carbamazepini TaxID=2854259 RepID=UPI002149D1D9|nr:carboxymuconolactone decarboxylase family protein [Nocardioides carbamazepini]MCR1782463.1 carboxymuconolactone decarboxylase family protein [Nocardioides carbamazepini]
MHYHDTDDKAYHRTLRGAAPAAVEAFTAFDQAVFGTEGALDAKTKELIAIAVAATTQCPYCMEAHAGGAKKAGASESEVAEAVMVAAALRAGGALTHGWLALKQYAEA